VASYALIRPNNRKVGYQQLADRFMAIEAPLWLMMRSAQLKKNGNIVFELDQEVNGDIEPLNIDYVEFFPFGNHPSGFMQGREGVKDQMFDMGQKSYTKCWTKLPDFDIDLIPDWKSMPVEKYRCHNWHAWGGFDRSPYGVLFTSLSCPFQCSFCVIKNYYGTKHRLRSVDSIIKDLKSQIDCGIRNIKIIDELFLLNKVRVADICDKIIEIGVPDLNMWCFARLDTCSPDILKKMRKAGIRWIGIGVESGNEEIRKKELKGAISNEKIIDICGMVRDCGVNICPNYMFGFEDDTQETMEQTFNLAMDIQGECSNFNCMMAYPGTKVYQNAVSKGWEVPNNWSGYAQQGYDCNPLRTNSLMSQEVLSFRDKAFMTYYTNPSYISMMLGKFGDVEDIQAMTSIKLKRRILGN